MIGRFLVRCLIFTVVALSMLLAINSMLTLANPSMYDMRGAHVLFLGNSHIETAINPDSIGDGVRNFGRSAEVAEYVYAKLRLAHRYNPGLDTVYVGVDNQMIYHDGDEFIQFHPSFHGALDMSDYAAVIRYGSFECMAHHVSHPFGIGKTFEYILLPASEGWDMRQTRTVGGFLSITRNRLDKAIERRARDMASAPGEGDESRIALYFIDRIYEYCRENDIALFFLVVPQHRLSPYDRTYFRQVQSERYPDVVTLDFMDAPMADSCYSDLHHLNAAGAGVFSRYLRDSVFSRPLPAVSCAYTDSII